jgi:hypothetical protein
MLRWRRRRRGRRRRGEVADAMARGARSSLRMPGWRRRVRCLGRVARRGGASEPSVPAFRGSGNTDLIRGSHQRGRSHATGARSRFRTRKEREPRRSSEEATGGRGAASARMGARLLGQPEWGVVRGFKCPHKFRVCSRGSAVVGFFT